MKDHRKEFRMSYKGPYTLDNYHENSSQVMAFKLMRN